MFNKVALFFYTLVTSSVLVDEPQTTRSECTAPIPDIGNDVFQQCLDAGGDDFTCAQEAEAPPTCNKDLITSNIADLKSITNPEHWGTPRAFVTSSLQTVVKKTGTAIGSLIADWGESGPA
ncbi:hypothetical protein B0H14DRAFT_3732789 [Mycena olivaceomarginata]|nr:hypothetical protein B0H14DRAFT_3732789 [Mycena olivaceomarginata]